MQLSTGHCTEPAEIITLLCRRALSRKSSQLSTDLITLLLSLPGLVYSDSCGRLGNRNSLIRQSDCHPKNKKSTRRIRILWGFSAPCATVCLRLSTSTSLLQVHPFPRLNNLLAGHASPIISHRNLINKSDSTTKTFPKRNQ